MFAKVGGIECLRKLQDAPIAQIRGGFINWEWDYLRKWVRIECLKKLQDAPIAQIKGGFINWGRIFCESGVLCEIGVRDCLFLEKNRAYILCRFF